MGNASSKDGLKEYSSPAAAGDEKDGSRSTKVEEDASEQGKYIMISYIHQDMDMMRKLKGLLEEAGITVSADETGHKLGTSSLLEIGDEIIDCSAFLAILSTDSVTSKYWMEEISLAYMTNKNIFAVAVNPFDELKPVMELGTRSILSLVQPHVVDKSNIKQQIEPLISRMKGVLTSVKKEEEASDEDVPIYSGLEKLASKYVMNKQAFELVGLLETMFTYDDSKFYSSAFGEKNTVHWHKFQQILLESYDDLIQHMLTETDIPLLFDFLKEIFSEDVKRKSFDEFCYKGGKKLPFPQALCLHTMEKYVMKKVFDINSSVRLPAIMNLHKYQTRCSIASLCALFETGNPVKMATSAIAFASAGSKLKILKDVVVDCLIINYRLSADPLVRECTCLALGNLKDPKALHLLLKSWREDTSLSVREAARNALNEISPESAEGMVDPFIVLSGEMSLLKG